MVLPDTPITLGLNNKKTSLRDGLATRRFDVIFTYKIFNTYKKHKQIRVMKNNTNNTGTGFTPSQLKFFKKAAAGDFNDIKHADGSKSYANVRGGHIKIDKPLTVQFVDFILSQDFRNWSYMPTLDKALNDNHITKEEYNQIMLILD